MQTCSDTNRPASISCHVSLTEVESGSEEKCFTTSTLHEEEPPGIGSQAGLPEPSLYTCLIPSHSEFTKNEPVTFQSQLTPFPKEFEIGGGRERKGGYCELRSNEAVVVSCHAVWKAEKSSL